MARMRFLHWLPRAVGYEAMLRNDRRLAHQGVAESLEAAHVPRGAWRTDGVATDAGLCALVLGPSLEWGASGTVSHELGFHWRDAGAIERGALYDLLAAKDDERHGRVRP